MAFTAREVIMTFRGQNYLSSAIRRVGRDVGSLSRTQALTQQRAALQLARQRIQLSQRAAQAELVSVQPGGARSLAIQKARNAALAEQANLTRQIGARETALLGIQGSRLANTTKIANLQRDIGNVPGELQAQRAAIRAQIQQLTTGTRALALQKAQVAAQVQENRELVQTDALTKRIMVNDEQQLRLQARLLRLQTIPATSKKFVGVPQDIAAIRAQQSRLATEREQLLARQVGLAPAAMAQQEAQLAALNAQEGELISKTEALKASYRDVGAKGATQLATLRNALARANIESARLVGREAELRASVEAARKALQEQGLTLQQIDAREAQLAEREAQLTQTLLARGRAEEIVTQKLRQNAIAMASLPWETFQRGARAVEHAGRVLQMFGLISTAVFGYSAEQAAKFATQSTLAATQIVDIGNRSVKNVQQVGKEINDALAQFLASGQTTAKPEELTQGIYAIYSSISLPGNQKQRVQEGINLLKQYNQVLTANYGFVSFNDVVRAGNILINDFGYNVKNIGPALNTMQAGVRFGNMTMGQFISTLSQAAPAAKGAGVNFNQMVDSITFLSRKFPSIRFAATGYARLVEVLHRNSDEFKNFGVSVDDAHGRLRPLDQIFAQLVRRFPGLRTGALDFGNVLKEITGSTATFQARRAGIFFIQDVKGYHSLAQQVNRDNGELARSAIAAGTSPGVAWAKFTNQLRGLVLLIGQGAIPAFSQLAKPVERAIQWFDQLSPRTQRLIGYVGALASVLSLLGGTVLAVVGGFASLVISFRLMAGFSKGGEGILGLGFAAKNASTEVAALSSEAGFISAKLALGLGAFAAIPLLIRYHKEVGNVVGALGGFKNVMTLLTALVGGFTLARIISGLTILDTAVVADIGVVNALRASLLGLAGLAVTATVLVIERHKIEDAAKKALTGSGIPGFDPNLGPHIDPNTGEIKVHFNSGFLGSVERNFGQDATKGIGGFMNRLTHSGDQFSPSLLKLQREYLLFAKTTKAPLGESTFNRFSKMIQTEGITSKNSLQDFKFALRDFQGKPAGFGLGSLDTIFGNVANSAKAIAERAKAIADINRRRNAIQVTRAVQRVRRDPSLTQQIEEVKQLNLAYDKAPSLNSLNKYLRARKTLVDRYSGTEKQAIEQLLKQTTTLGPAAQTRSIQGWIALVEQARKRTLGNPNDLQAQLAYEKVQAQLNQRFKDQPQLLAAINDVLQNYDQNIKNTTANANQLGVTFQDVLTGIQNMYQGFQQTETGLFGGLFQGPFMAAQDKFQFGARMTGQDALRDIRSQLTQFRNFHGELNRLQRRGAPRGLVQELIGLGSGPEQLRNLQAINSLSPSQLKQYFNAYNQGQQLIKAQTMRDLNAQLKIYRQHGRNIALAIIAGLRDENVNLTTSLTRMIRRMFPGLPVGETGAGGRPTHRRTPQAATPAVNVHVHPNDNRDNKPPITKRAQQRHAELRTKNKHSVPVGGPR